MTTITTDTTPFNQTIRAKIAACDALELSYWADHPASGCIWAVDANQQPHVVRWYRKTNQVALQHVGKPHRVIDYTAWPVIAYRDVYPTYDAGDRIMFSTQNCIRS